MLAAGLGVKNCPCLSKQTWSREGVGETGSSAFLPLSVCRQGDDGRNRQIMEKGKDFLTSSF